MSTKTSGRQDELRSLIEGFLSERLNAKLEKLPADSPSRSALTEQFVPFRWLEDAVRRVGQIQAVSHSLKPIHPDAIGSSLFREPLTLASINEVGSHTLGKAFDTDVDGNAGALDVYKFLKLELRGNSLLNLAIQSDADLCAVLNPDPAIAAAWMQAFAGLVKSRRMLSSHTYAKQIYWLVGGDPHDDSCYHLLAPLYPTSLVHRVYQTIQDDRFGEIAKAAREARKAAEWHECPVREYPHLAIQKLGGSNPQNISQLNRKRNGNNYLFASLPPVWQTPSVKPLLGVLSLFEVFRWRREVRALSTSLRHLLESDSARNRETRARRNDLVDSLLDELIQFIAEVQTLATGWSADPTCDLPSHQVAWLDSDTTEDVSSDVIDRLASDFANWLNSQLRDPLPLGDAEYLHWRSQARDLLKEAKWESAHGR